MKYFASLIIIISLISCKTETKNQKMDTDTAPKIDDAFIESATIYEANIRQYSPEGTLNAFTKDIPSLKNLGVKIIWLMPIYPISETKRKATGGEFVSDIKDPEERKKYLGSYYAVSDYTEVNPNMGTKEDLRNLVKTAHENGIAVILDWVPNHTGWDHKWIKEHPDFYTKNAQGEITDPLNDEGNSMGWQDVADLNYNNPEMRKAMIADMKYWLEKEDIDGFRCDVAMEVPNDFWEDAIAQLRAVKPIFMLAEAEQPDLLQGGKLFDMCYGWENHHLMAEIAQGHKNVKDWYNYMAKIDSVYEPDDIHMNMVTNHDENSWNGTVEEKFGDASELATVLTYVTPGMPLIYSGQEYGLDHRLKFFEKDQIPKTKGKFYALYEKLAQLKESTKAIDGGKKAAAYHPIITDKEEQVLAFTREKEGDKLTFVANFSATPVEVTIPFEGEFTDYMSGDKMTFTQGEKITLQPWQYYILQ